MPMIKISVEGAKKLAKKHGLKPCRVPGTDGVRIRKHRSLKLEDVSWEEFEKTLKKRKLAVYKAEDSDFLKIMRERWHSRISHLVGKRSRASRRRTRGPGESE